MTISTPCIQRKKSSRAHRPTHRTRNPHEVKRQVPRKQKRDRVHTIIDAQRKGIDRARHRQSHEIIFNGKPSLSGAFCQVSRGVPQILEYFFGILVRLSGEEVLGSAKCAERRRSGLQVQENKLFPGKCKEYHPLCFGKWTMELKYV